jgi:hypothetical protein
VCVCVCVCVFCLMLLLMMMILLARLARYYVYLSHILQRMCVCRWRWSGIRERDSTLAGGKSLSLLYSAGIDIWWQCQLLYCADPTALLPQTRYHFITLKPLLLFLATESWLTGLLGRSLTFLRPCGQAPRHDVHIGGQVHARIGNIGTTRKWVAGFMLWLSTPSQTLRHLLVRRPSGFHSRAGRNHAEEKILNVMRLEDRLHSDSWRMTLSQKHLYSLRVLKNSVLYYIFLNL